MWRFFRLTFKQSERPNFLDFDLSQIIQLWKSLCMFFFVAELRTKWAAKRRKTTNMTRSCDVYSGKLILTIRVFRQEVSLGMVGMAPNSELKHSGLCRIGCRSRIFDICFVQKVLLHTPYTSSSLLRKATTARCYRSRGPLFPCFLHYHFICNCIISSHQ